MDPLDIAGMGGYKTNMKTRESIGRHLRFAARVSAVLLCYSFAFTAAAATTQSYHYVQPDSDEQGTSRGGYSYDVPQDPPDYMQQEEKNLSYTPLHKRANSIAAVPSPNAAPAVTTAPSALKPSLLPAAPATAVKIQPIPLMPPVVYERVTQPVATVATAPPALSTPVSTAAVLPALPMAHAQANMSVVPTSQTASAAGLGQLSPAAGDNSQVLLPLPGASALPPAPAAPLPAVLPTPLPPAPASASPMALPTPLPPAAASSLPPTPLSSTPLMPAAPAPELSQESKQIIHELPEEKQPKNKKTSTAENTPPLEMHHTRKNVMERNLDVKQHEGVGISISIKRKQMNVNHMLEQAYDALIAGNQEDAITIYKQVLEERPDDKLALFGLATTYHRAGQIQLARPLYGRLLELDPKNVEGLNNFLVLLADESPEAALEELQKLQETHPNFSPLPAQIATIYEKMGNYDRAAESMERAILLSPENLKYRYNMAIILDKRGSWDAAGDYYQQLLLANERGEKIPAKAEEIQERLTFIRSNKPKGSSS